MSTTQRLTLIGLYNYDSTLFDGLILPEGYDKDTFIDSLLLEHGEKCILYSNPDFMKNAIGAWGRKWSSELARIYTALTAEYNPIHNYDRIEEYNDVENRLYKSESNAGHKATDNPNFSVVQETNDDAVTEEQISADNSGDYQPEHKTIQNGGKSTATTSGTSQNLSETSNNTTNDEEGRELKHNAHLYGNIGITTSVQMWSEEVRARMQYNLYDVATRLFANELLIGIY